MSGIGLDITMPGLDQLELGLSRLMAVAKNTSKMLDAVGTEVESQTRKRIHTTKTGPDGRAWPAWSPTYAKTRHGGQSLLMSSGNFLDSITHEVRADGVEVGSNKVQAATLQFGDQRYGAVYPPRPYLGLAQSDEERIVEMIHGFFDGVFE